MIAKQFVFDSNQKRLFAVLYTPMENEAIARARGFIMLHPFAEEKKSSHRVFVEIARSLCRLGHSILLFDLSGCGDSEGEFADATISDWIEDGQQAILFLKNQVHLGKISLIGLRLGGFLALQIAEQNDAIDELILLEPVLNPKMYLHQTLRQKLIKELHTNGQVVTQRKDLFQNLEHDESIDFDGYEISSKFYQDLMKFPLVQEKMTYQGKLFLIHISSRKRMAVPYATFLNTFQARMNHISALICLMPPFWNRLELPDVSVLVNEIVNYVKHDH